MSFLRKLLPKQGEFFPLFQKMANLVEECAKEFNQLFYHLENKEHYVLRIQDLEEQGDEVAHVIFSLLHKTFITPFDRNDIYHLTDGLDDILDQMNRCAQRLPFYHLETIPTEINQLVSINLTAAKALRESIILLESLENQETIIDLCRQIDHAESEAHQCVISGEKNLFIEENDFKCFFKFKDIYARTKLVTDAMQDAGNVIKGIVLEYA